METTFSMTRVQHIMRRDLIENCKSNLYGLLGIFAACFFPMLGFLWSAERWTEEGYPEVYSFERFCGNMLGIIGMVVSVAMIYYASHIMKCMDNKEKRISYLLLPATKLEKFFSRALFVTIGTVLMILVALLALELTHYLLLPVFDLPAVYSQPMLVEVFSLRWAHASVDATGEPVYSWWLMQLLVWIFCLWNHSLFILGGKFLVQTSFPENNRGLFGCNYFRRNLICESGRRRFFNSLFRLDAGTLSRHSTNCKWIVNHYFSCLSSVYCVQLVAILSAVYSFRSC